MKIFSRCLHLFRRNLTEFSFLLAQLATATVFSGVSQAAIDIPNATSSSATNPKSGAVKVDAVEARLVSNFDGKAPEGESLRFAVLLKHDPHWHTYWRNPGDSGLPTQIDWKLPKDWQVGAIDWPVPQRIPIGPLVNYGYEGQLLLPVLVKLPKEGAGSQIIQAKVQWLMCKDVCIPGEAELALSIDSGMLGGPTKFKQLFDEAERNAVKPGNSGFRAIFANASNDFKLRVELNAANLTVDKKAGQEVDFFPYRAELLQPASPLKVFVEGSSDQALALRVETKWVEGVKPPEVLEGLLVVNGKGFEVSAKKTDAWVDAKGDSLLVSHYKGPKAASNLAAKSTDSLVVPTVVNNEPILLTLMFAFIGGLILNLMPCVFPVLGLKVLGFASHVNASSKKRLQASLLFAAGVVGSFWLLSMLMIVLQSAGQAVGWGFQLQSPWFVSAMAWLFALIGLNLTGLFEVGVSLTRASFDEQKSPSLWSELGSGALAVLVATPCTAPFMGAALGATLGQSVVTQLGVFTMIGLGMALPYVLLTLVPNAAKLLPKPGEWMQTLKQFLAFPMFATVAWLVWVYGQQLDVDAVFMLLLSLVMLGLAAWLYGLWQRHSLIAGGASSKAIVLSVLTLVAIASGVMLLTQADRSDAAQVTAKPFQQSTATAGWEVWSNERVAELLAQGRPVFVDFTAAWCVSCQVNKKAVLERDAVRKFFADQKVALLRADWTKRDAAITEELARYKRNGVPMYQVWLPTAGPRTATLLPELLTQDLVISAFK
jgi:thiol:disulfide interchange protein